MKFTGKTPNTYWKSISRKDYGTRVTQVSSFSSPGDTHLLVQGSEEWKEARKNTFCTASALGSLLGLGWGKDQREESKEVNMSWGRNHEANGLKSILDDPYLERQYPGFTIEESGLWTLDISCDQGEKPLLIGASFDGILVTKDDSGRSIPRCLLEIKCPCPFFWKEDIQEYSYQKRLPASSIHPAYIAQIQMQLLIATKVFQRDTYGEQSPLTCLFVSWTPSGGTSVFRVPYCPEYAFLLTSFLLQKKRAESLTEDECINSRDILRLQEDLLSRTREMSEKIVPERYIFSATSSGEVQPLFDVEDLRL